MSAGSKYAADPSHWWNDPGRPMMRGDAAVAAEQGYDAGAKTLAPPSDGGDRWGPAKEFPFYVQELGGTAMLMRHDKLGWRRPLPQDWAKTVLEYMRMAWEEGRG